VVASFPPQTKCLVIDPFAGSCNTLYWILQHVLRSRGIAFEVDSQVYELTRHSVAGLNRTIVLIHGDYRSLLDKHRLPCGDAIIVFVAPPWGTALDEVEGLDLRRTEPPITEIITRIGQTYPDRQILFAIQVYEKVNAEIAGRTVAGRNHGILLGTKGWKP